MYARVTVLEWKTGERREGIDETLQILHDSIVPVAKQQPGFKGFLGLLDRTGGKGIAITLWETEADLEAGESSGYYREQLAKLEHLSHLYALPPYREVYEVVIQE